MTVSQFSQREIQRFLTALDRPKDQEVRQALFLLITDLKTNSPLSPTFGDHGVIKDIRFLLSERNYFALTVNDGWLLWYFRRPAISDGLVDTQDVKARFPTAQEKSNSEWAVRIHSFNEATDVANYVKGLPFPH
jgi:hypothetical protein